MNKAALIERLANESGISKKEAERTLESLVNIIISELKAGREVTITGFGTFLARTRHARGGVNPQKPSERIQIPEVTVAKFKTGKTLKDALKGKIDVPGSTEEAPAETAEVETPEATESME